MSFSISMRSDEIGRVLYQVLFYIITYNQLGVFVLAKVNVGEMHE